MSHLAPSPVLRQKYFPAIGGLIFLVIFGLRYAALDADFFFLRDDGIITYSHARNLVDFGFVGVNPSGERIEGFSAPVQFWIFAAAYSLGLSSPAVFNVLQTAISTFGMGVLFYLFFSTRPAFALLATASSALLLSGLTSFIQWHGSGMENALTHLLFLSTLYVAFVSLIERRINLAWVVVPLLASLSRLEGIVHVLPILFLWSVYWAKTERNARAFVFTSVFLSLWAGYHVWRFLYFGSLTPNTAVAQGISVASNLSALAGFQEATLEAGARLAKKIFAAHGGFCLVVAVPMLLFATWRREYAVICVLALAAILTGLLHPYLFGETRLDATRSTTQLAPLVCLVVCAVGACVRRARGLVVALAVVPALIFLWKTTFVAPYNMCCKIQNIESFHRDFVAVAQAEGIPRPTVSNPDLGLMSWHKTFNVVDIGMLGSSVISRLRSGPLFSEYFFDFAAPDLLESHVAWSCLYHESLFSDPRFQRDFQAVSAAEVQRKRCPGKTLPVGIWVRKAVLRGSGSVERAFLDRLAEGGATPALIREEVAACVAKMARESDCAYISRTVYRFLPEARKRWSLVEIAGAFRDSPTLEFDRLLILGSEEPRLHEDFIKMLSSRARAPAVTQ